MKKTFYCKQCGRQLIEESIGAEHYYFGSEAGRIYTSSSYNAETGNRQIVCKYTCPQYKKSIWNFCGNGHDDFMHEDVYQETEFGKWDLVK